MGRRDRPARAAIILAALLTIATTAAANKCNLRCHGLKPGSYQEGRTYVYDFEGTSVTSVTEAQGEAKLKLKAEVELTAKPDCVQQLRLKNVRVNGAPVSQADVEKHALQFSYHDGHIDTEVCAESGDSQASLNVKRAVASLFQSAIFQDSGTTSHTEVDVLGGCPTDFSFTKDGDTLVVKKHRNLEECSHRENIRQGLITAVFDHSAEMKSTPVLESHQRTEQTFKNGILNKATSVETHRFQPFRNGDAGAKTIVESVLTLKGEKGDSPTAPVTEPKSIIFEAPHPVANSSPEAIGNALKAARKEETNDVTPHAAEKFSELVKVVRASTKNDLLSVYHKVQAGAGFDKVRDKKILLSALFRAGTGETVEVAAELVKNKEITGAQALMFYASLALVHHVNLPSVSSIITVLDQPDLPRIGYLGVGQVIGKYCEEHNCENVPEIKNAIHKLREKIGNGRAKTREQEDVVVTALKALGNTKFLDDATLQKIANIATDKNVRNRVRVAALETLPTRCTMKWKNMAMKVFEDQEEDSELRIKSYLSLVECACPHVGNKVREVLDKEKINQVGSFVTSHLRNLRASTNPNKQEAKRHLGLIKPKTKFPEDFRKFSFNNEFSYNMDAFGVGSAVETNVIYSQNSFVPRSTNLNFTSEVFGHSFNWLELNARVENLDRLIEHYFGPKGEISNLELDDVTETGVQRAQDIVDYIKERVRKLQRRKREVKQGELDRFAKGVHLRGNELDQNLELDLSMKLFGVELAYLSQQVDTSKLSIRNLVDKVFADLEAGLNRFKNFDYSLENRMQFLDGEFVYPTAMGTPLRLGVVGTSVVHLATSGKIDLPSIMKDPQNAAFKVAVEPSASIRVVGNVVVDGFGSEAGLRMVSNLHTSTGTDLQVKLLDGKGVDVSLGVPKKKQEIVTVSSEVLLSSGPKGEKYVAPKFDRNTEHTDCFDQFATILGLTVCGHISYPYSGVESVQKRALTPLSGPTKFSVTVETNDVSSYRFKAFYDTNTPNVRSLEILFDTPNSRTSRHVSLAFKAGLEPNKFVKASFDSPIRKLAAEAVLKDNQQEKTLTVTVNNDQIEYFARAGLVAEGSRYKPVLEYKVPEHVEQLSGIKATDGNRQTYNVEGTVDVSEANGGKKYVFNKVYLTAGERKIVGIDGTVTAAPNDVQVDANVGYGDETLALKVDAKRNSERNYALSVTAVPSKDPNVGFKLNWDYKRDETEFDNRLTFVHGPDLNSETNKLTVRQRAVYKLDPNDVHLSGSSKVAYPALGLDFELEGDMRKKSLGFEIDFKYDKFKFGTEFAAKVDTNKPGDYEVELELELLNNALEVKSKRMVISPHSNRYVNSLKLTPGGQYEADVTATCDVKQNNAKIELKGDLDLNGKKVNLYGDLDANLQKLYSKALVQVDGTKYVDYVLTIQRGANANGNLKLNLKNYLTAQGNFNLVNGKGSGQLNVDIPKLGRNIKATGTVALSDTQRKADFELLYDASRDPSRRIQFSTVTDVAGHTFDSRNVLEILSYRTEANVKFACQGEMNNGQQNLHIELTLPNKRYLVYDGDRAIKRKGDDQYEGYVKSDLLDHVTKGSQPRRLSVRNTLHDLDGKVPKFDVTSEITFVDFDGKDLKLVTGTKHLPKDGTKKETMLAVDATGSLMPDSFSLALSGDYDEHNVNWKGKSLYGGAFSLESSGSMYHETGKPNKFDGTLKAKLPSSKLRNIRLDVSESLLVPHEEDGTLDYSGSYKVTYNDDKKVQVDGQLRLTGSFDDVRKSEGNGKLTLIVLDNPPLSIGGSYNEDPTGERSKVSGNANLKYGDKEANLAGDATFTHDLSSVDFNLKGTTSVEKLRNIDLHMSHKRENEGLIRKTDVTLVTDAGKYTMSSDIQVSHVSPSINIVFTCPQGKTELLAKFNKLGERDYTGEWKLDTPQGFVAADAHINLESTDDFLITINFDSDKIKQRKIHAEIANKPTPKTGRRVMIVVTSDGKNIVTGSTNYKKRDEDGKIVVEGNGNLKIGENTRSSSFKYTRQQLTREVDGEIGVAMVLNANFGPSAIVGELKFSNKEILVFNSYCEQSKDCAHFKLHAALDSDHKTYIKHQITVEVDLKKFNVPVEFGLKTSTDLKDIQLDHVASLYLHSSKGKSEYTYQLYVHPKEAASILTLPTRELALTVTLDMPRTKQAGAYKLDVSHYFDRKNKPTEKSSLTITGDVNIEKNSASMNGEAKFTYPSQTKDMIVKGKLHYGGEHLLDANLDLDVFAKKVQKISVVARVVRVPLDRGYNFTSSVEVNSRGQQLKVENQNHFALSPRQLGFGAFLSYTDVHQKLKTIGVLFSANPDQVNLLAVAPKRELLRADAKFTVTKNLQKIENEIAVLGNKPCVTTIEAQDLNNFKFLQYCKNNPNTKVTANGRIVIGQLLEFHADAYKDGAKKNLFNVLIHLDEDKFLKPDFGYNKDNVVAVIEYERGKALEAAQQLKDVANEISKEAITELKDLVDHLKKAQPNIKPLLEYYETERSKVRNELHADQTIKEIQAALNKLFGGITNILVDTATQFTERLKDLYTQYLEILSKITDAIQSTYPQLVESYKKIFKAAVEVVDAFTSLCITYLKAVMNVVNEHQKELKDLAVTASELVQDVAKVVFRAISQLNKDLKEFVVLLYQQVKALPVFEVIVQQYEDVKQYGMPETVMTVVDESCNALKALLPTPELQDFVTVTCDYVTKFLRHQKVDTESELKSISAHAISAVQSVLGLLQNYVSPDSLLSFLDLRVPFDATYLFKLPGVASLKISALNLLRNRELPTIADLYYTYRPTLYATDIVPPFSKAGIIADGGHVFTFDGRHLTLPGSCHYVLAQDFQDGNFSVVANLNNGKLESITLTEPRESMTIKSDGRLLVNGKPADYPASTKNLHAYLNQPAAGLKSRYGVYVTCSERAPLICTVRVSGFYLGKLRGLFGDGNNEPYDDFTLPSGKISENLGEFGNAYKLKPDCPAANAVTHQMQHAPVCTEYFSGNSPLSGCFNYVNPTNFREACDHAVSAGTPQGACLMAVAYYAACRQARITVNIPPACGHCKVGANKINVGDSFSVKIPTKEADIVFVVEQDTKNEKVYKELITPLMTELRDELKQHGITDVHIGLIGFGEKMEYPEHYTLNGSPNIEGEAKNMKFQEKEDPLVTLKEAKEGDYEKKLVYLGERLDVELGTFKLTDAYEEAIRYPFRPGAVKAVVGVIASPCEKSPFPISLQQLRILLGRKIYNDLGMTYYHVYLPGEVTVSGKPQKNIVGYDANSAYTFADSKKKPMEGSADLRSNMELPTKDVCADFAVSSGGAAFISNDFLEAKPNQKKQFSQVVARRIVDELTSTELEEDCVCSQVHGLFSRANCKIVNRNEKHTKGAKV